MFPAQRLSEVVMAGPSLAGKTAAAGQGIGRVIAEMFVNEVATVTASDESAFTTGQCHISDGGWSN